MPVGTQLHGGSKQAMEREPVSKLLARPPRGSVPSYAAAKARQHDRNPSNCSSAQGAHTWCAHTAEAKRLESRGTCELTRPPLRLRLRPLSTAHKQIITPTVHEPAHPERGPHSARLRACMSVSCLRARVRPTYARRCSSAMAASSCTARLPGRMPSSRPAR